jgi:hypothetical protein
MRGFCSRDDRVCRCVQRLMGGWISRQHNGLRHADSSLDFALHGSILVESGSRSGSIRTKLSLAGTVTMTVKGRFGGSPQNGDAGRVDGSQRIILFDLYRAKGGSDFHLGAAFLDCAFRQAAWNRRKAKTDHLAEGRPRLLFIFHDQARITEPDASGVDEARRKCGVSPRKLA